MKKVKLKIVKNGEVTWVKTVEFNTSVLKSNKAIQTFQNMIAPLINGEYKVVKRNNEIIAFAE